MSQLPVPGVGGNGSASEFGDLTGMSHIDGKNINKGLRLGKDGSLLPTRDSQGNLIMNTHNTEERLRD